MKLKALLKDAGIDASVPDDNDVAGLSYDSRTVKKGDLFFAIKGVHSDGHTFLEQVAKKQASAAVVEHPAEGPLPNVQVPSVLAAMSPIANVFYGRPSKRIPVIGVTGTNGKTTITYVIESILASVGKTSGVLGTVNYRIGEERTPAPNTTPMSLDVQAFIDKAAKKKAAAVVMEVSSHALELNRVDDVTFRVAVFTNLTQDHLDFHGTMENYFLAKRKLFARPEKPAAVINVDDDYGKKLAGEFPSDFTYGIKTEAKIKASEVRTTLAGNKFLMRLPSGKTHTVGNNLLGLHNVANCLAAAGALLALGLSESDVVKGLNKKMAVPGRLERVEAGQSFVVTVDYAHTHDALSQALTTLRETGPRKLICVFGAGGDRDRTKRPKMGDVSVRLADHVFVTSDNPRSEDPKKILLDIEVGIKKTGKTNYTVIEDREDAIRQAIKSAGKGDIVLIAGKGHEDYQIIGDKKIHFSDFDVARKALLA